MPLRIMLDMLGRDAAVVSLQKDVPEPDRDALRQATHVLDLSTELADLADTAAVISHLDLVVSVDTVAAHLAGALGKPVWVLLPAVAEWRWLPDREDSPWYPSARLFRQENAGDWASVASRVRDALRDLGATS
jgi:ADP-heptose:LPS heptosyltransferase